MIGLTCPSCGRKLQVRPELAGKQGKCPECKTPIQVPAAGRLSLSPKAAATADMPTLPPERGGSPLDVPSLPRLIPQPSQTQPLLDAALSADLYGFLAPPQQDDELGRLGPYRVLKIIGAGGMGVVYLAEDMLLRREVALKVMLPGVAAIASNRERFLREAQAAAALQHDHIITILQVGEDRGVPYLAMPFLKGETLEDRLQREGALPVSEVLRIGRETAEGLAAAQERQLIHRDIKPANLWLEGDKGRVKILDFGLARGASDSTHLTHQGTIIGTPAYMPPEQGSGKKLDGRADLFSLGCVLYRAATGEMPFQGDDMVAMLLAVATHQPKAPSALNPSIPPGLDDLILRLLEKSPDARPNSGRAVVAAIQGIEANRNARPLPARTRREATEPRRTSQGERKDDLPEREKRARHKSRKARKARPILPWLIAAAFLLMVVGTGVGIGALLLRRAGSTTASQLAQQPPSSSVPTSAAPPASRPAGTVPVVHPPPATRPIPDKFVLRDPDLKGPISLLAVSKDGERLYAGHTQADNPTSPSRILVWDWRAGKVLTTLQGLTQPVLAVALSPDGTQLLACGGDRQNHSKPGELLVWSLGTDRPPMHLTGHSGPVYHACFSPDGKRIASASPDRTLRLWNSATGTEVTTLPLPVFSSSVVAYSPDGRWLVTAGYEEKGKPLLVYNARTLREDRKFFGHGSVTNDLHFSPDSKWLASASSDWTLRIWDTATGTIKHSLIEHHGHVNALALSPRGRWLASVGADGVAKIWDTATGKRIREFRVSTAELTGVAFLAGADVLAIASKTGRIHGFPLDLPAEE
jgi:serine/threonine protein kinase/Tol biopolymer transport system component